jgi:hypothetical protein
LGDENVTRSPTLATPPAVMGKQINTLILKLFDQTKDNNMNSKIKTILIVTLILIIFIGYHLNMRFKETSDWKVKFHVYEYYNRNILNLYLRRIPILYDTLLKVERTEKYSKEYTLYKVDNGIYGGTPSIHYLIFNKDNGEITELKSESLLKNIKNWDNFDSKSIYSYLIDLNEFNYVYSNSRIEKQELFQIYCRLLANIEDSIYFREIKNIKDIEKVLLNLPKEKNKMSTLYESDLINKFEFLDSLNQDEKYYWYYDKGIIRFRFIINAKNELEQVESYKIGYLGNEVIHL